MCCALPWSAELHVVDGVPSFIFVQAKYTVEVGGWLLGGCCWVGGWVDLYERNWDEAGRCVGSGQRVSPSCVAPSCVAQCDLLHHPLPCPSPTSAATPPLSPAHVQSSEAERIGVDQVTKILPTGAASGTNQREWMVGGVAVSA